MISGTCHCASVRFEFNDTPKWATSCNCSICRRLGALWIYSKGANVTFTGIEHTLAYSYGDKNLTFHSCKTCGCTTHYSNVKDPSGPMAVNLRMADLATLESIRVRRFDGANTWSFLDE